MDIWRVFATQQLSYIYIYMQGSTAVISTPGEFLSAKYLQKGWGERGN